MILYPPEILKEFHRYTIFLDTNVFSSAARSKELIELLTLLQNEGECALTTIPSVLFEVTKGSDNLTTYNQRAQLVKEIVDSINPADFINDISDFSAVMAKLNAKNNAYTDFILAACLYRYQHAPVALMTSDMQMLPGFYNRVAIIAIEEGKSVKNFAIYTFDSDKYEKAAHSVLKSR